MERPVIRRPGRQAREAAAARLSRALVGCYPPRWKQRYQDELLDVLDQHQASARTVLSLAGGALATHLDPDYRTEYPVLSTRYRTAIKVITRTIVAAAAAVGVLAGLFFFARAIGLPDFSWQPIPTSGANALAVTPDQRLLATEVGGEPTSALVTLWSLGPAGLRRLSAFEGGLTVAIAPDGRLVATSAFHGQPALWTVARPRHPALLEVLSAGSSGGLWGEAFTRAGTTRPPAGREPDPGRAASLPGQRRRRRRTAGSRFCPAPQARYWHRTSSRTADDPGPAPRRPRCRSSRWHAGHHASGSP
jgi:hypothetical protein